jgi:NAD-dependent DNA ligase
MMDYFKFTTKSRLDKSINTLLGILEGIAADQTVSTQEWELLGRWAEGNKNLADRHPYNELVPRLIEAMADGVLSEEEHQNMLWLCNKLRSAEYYDLVTADIQRLQAILGAIVSDEVISEAELETLSNWLEEHTHLRQCWPFDEVDSLITAAMKDHWIDPAEQRNLLEYFSSFTPADLDFDKPTSTANTLQGICSVTPEIVFDDRLFCFTGESTRASRDEMKIMVLDRGGQVRSAVSPRLNYLIVGSNGNPCWAYACYGRKIEKAIQLRQQGENIVIVHEADFFDSLD